MRRRIQRLARRPVKRQRRLVRRYAKEVVPGYVQPTHHRTSSRGRKFRVGEHKVSGFTRKSRPKTGIAVRKDRYVIKHVMYRDKFGRWVRKPIRVKQKF